MLLFFNFFETDTSSDIFLLVSACLVGGMTTMMQDYVSDKLDCFGFEFHVFGEISSKFLSLLKRRFYSFVMKAHCFLWRALCDPPSHGITVWEFWEAPFAHVSKRNFQDRDISLQHISQQMESLKGTQGTSPPSVLSFLLKSCEFTVREFDF